MRRKLLAFAFLWAIVAGVLVAAPGCYGENCNGGREDFGADPGQGHMLSDTQWESNATDGKWLHFPRQRTYSFDIKALGGRTPFQIIPFLAATEFQNQPGGNNVIGAGNIALMYNVRPNGVDVLNDTCSDYYLRLTINVPPFPPENQPPPVTDAGTP